MCIKGKAKPFSNASGSGFTLWEVLLALALSGLLLSLSLRLINEQWRIGRELKAQLEVQYAVLVAGQEVSKAIQSAYSVEWVSPGTLRVSPWTETGSGTLDLYYLADKDRDGISDLYREHLNVPNPIVSHVTGFSCMEVEPGLWQISLQARLGTEQAVWQNKVRQRTYQEAGSSASGGILLSWSWFCW